MTPDQVRERIERRLKKVLKEMYTPDMTVNTISRYKISKAIREEICKIMYEEIEVEVYTRGDGQLNANFHVSTYFASIHGIEKFMKND